MSRATCDLTHSTDRQIAVHHLLDWGYNGSMTASILHELTDDDLIKTLQGGEAPARDALFARYRLAIYRFFSNKVLPEDAEDLTQRVLIVLLKRLDRTGTVLGNFRSFAFGVARRVLLRFCSDRARGHRFDPDVHTLADLDPSLSRQLSQSRHVEWLRRALQELPLEVVTLLDFRYVQRLTYAEIARIYQVPAGTVASRVRLAIQRLSAMRAAVQST